MRVDLIQEGNKEIDVELNGTKIEHVLWADDATGECEVFETDWRTGELVKAPDTEWGYRTTLLKGKVKVNDRRPKAPAVDPAYDFQYPGLCYLQVSPAQSPNDYGLIFVASHPERLLVMPFTFSDCRLSVLVEAVIVLAARLNLHHVEVREQGKGSFLVDTLKVKLPTSVRVQTY